MFRFRLWPFRRDASSRILIGAGGANIILIGQSACRLLAFTVGAIDSMPVGASGSLHLDATPFRVKLLKSFLFRAEFPLLG